MSEAPIKTETAVYSAEVTMTDARAKFGSLVRRVAHAHERFAVTDHGHVAAILINPQDLEDLEDSLALAEYQQRVSEGSAQFVTHEEAKLALGLADS